MYLHRVLRIGTIVVFMLALTVVAGFAQSTGGRMIGRIQGAVAGSDRLEASQMVAHGVRENPWLR